MADTAALPSVAESIGNAQHQIWEAEQQQIDPIDMPKPVEVDNTDYETLDQKKVRERRESLKSAKEKVEKASKAEKSKEAKTVGDNYVDDLKVRRDVIGKRIAESKEGNAASSKELTTKEAREHRSALRQRYPNAKLSEIFTSFEAWDADFKKDPVGTRERLMAHYLKSAPQNFAEPKSKEYAQGLRGSLQRAKEDQDDLSDLEPFIAKHGKNFPHIFRQLVEFDRDLAADPVGTSARLAATYGAVTEPQQRAAQQEQFVRSTQPQTEDVAPSGHVTPENLYKAIDLIVKQQGLDVAGDMPRIGDGMLHRIAEVFERGWIKCTGNHAVDFKAAYRVVVESDAGAKAAAASKSKSETEGQQRALQKGSRSISGAPAADQGAAPSGSAKAALQRAAGVMR